jgi:hypothetical protein
MNAEKINLISKEVAKFFDLDDTALFNLKVDNGLKYLEQHFSQDPELVNPLRDHPDFWLWWRELWAQRDSRLIAMCERKFYGYLYTFPIGKEVVLPGGKSYTPTDSTRVFNDNVWDFYKAFHHPRNVKFYPNHILISNCMQAEQQKVKSIF